MLGIKRAPRMEITVHVAVPDPKRPKKIAEVRELVIEAKIGAPVRAVRAKADLAAYGYAPQGSRVVMLIDPRTDAIIWQHPEYKISKPKKKKKK